MDSTRSTIPTRRQLASTSSTRPPAVPATVSDLFSVLAQRDQAPAVTDHQTSWTANELLGRASAAAALFISKNLPSGQPLPGLLINTPFAIAAVLGGMASGHPVAPLGPRLQVDELATAVTSLGASVLLATPETAATAQAVADHSGTRLLILTDLPPCDDPPESPCDEQIGFILHTSGTTGQPKPVPAPVAATRHRVEVYRRILALGPDSRYWTASPFHHIAGVGMMLTALAAGATVLAVPHFSPACWQALAELRPTHCLLVPTMIDQLLAAGVLGAASPRVLQYGAAPITRDLLSEATQALPGTDFVQVYGQTEGNPICCLTAEDHRRARALPELLETVGRPVPGLELAVDTPDAGGIGEIRARAGHLFAPGPDGWLATGDLGQLDAAGYLRLTGRRGDKIIRGGENIYPAEVESVLRAHPGIADVAVVGTPDRRWGQTVHAAVVPAGHPPDPEELRRWTRERLPGFKVPATWTFVSELPRNAAGKVLRRALIPPTAPHTEQGSASAPNSIRSARGAPSRGGTANDKEPMQ